MIPRTLLARTFLLLATLVILTTTAWLSLFRYIEAEPRARETAQLAASAVNLIRASLFAAAPEKRLNLFAEFSTREGIRLLPAELEDNIEAMPDSRFHRLLQHELANRLGAHTRVAASVDEVAHRRDEDQQAARQHTGHGQRQDHLPEHPPVGAVEVAGGLQQA